MANSIVTGIDEFRTGLVTGMANQRSVIRNQLEALGVQMVAEMRANAPRKTGALAASIHAETIDTNHGEKLDIQIGDEVAFYAAHDEYGTAHQPARPFVRPVFYRYEKLIPGQMEQSIVNAWGTQ
jgi:HK97 gp10 family phage protein